MQEHATNSDNHNRDVVIDLKVEGGVLDDSLPLPLLLSTLNDAQTLFDRSLLSLTGKLRLNTETRDKFFLEVLELKHGSLLGTFGLVFSGIQPTLPILGELGPKGIFDLVKNSYSLLKAVLSANQKGQTVSITQTGNDNKSLVALGNQNIIIDTLVVTNAKDSLPTYEHIAKEFQRHKLRSFTLADKTDGEKMTLNSDDVQLFTNITSIDELPKDLDVDVLDLNKVQREGLVKVLPGQTVEAGKYRFQVIGDQDITEYIDSMKTEQVRLRCLLELQSDPLRGSKIARLQVLKVL